jgi:hypothetical protein
VTTTLRAGVARADITPPIGIGHAGWGAQTHQRASGVDLPLWVTALALGQGDTTTVIVDIDCMYLFEQEASAVRDEIVRRTGLPEGQVRISFTHTHSGPVSGETWSAWMSEGAELVAAYDARIADQAGGVAWAAIRSMQPVRVGTGSGESDISINRRFQRPGDDVVVVGRNSDGPVDREVQVIRFDTVKSDPFATVVSFACHPITVGPDNDLITPDYPGAMKRVVEQATGSTCLFLQGAAGDIGPIRGVARNGTQEYRRLGTMLGHEASRIWWEMELPARTESYEGTLESGAPLAIYTETPEAEADRSLRVISRVVNLPTRQIGDPDAYEREFAEHIAELDHLRLTGSDEDVRQQTMLAKRAGMRAGLARKIAGHDSWPVELHAIGIGSGIALLGMAAEPFAEIGMAIKARSPFKVTHVSGYTGVGWAYLPTAEAFPLGGYEVEILPFAPEAANAMVEASVALLEDLKRKMDAGG